MQQPHLEALLDGTRSAWKSCLLRTFSRPLRALPSQSPSFHSRTIVVSPWRLPTAHQRAFENK